MANNKNLYFIPILIRAFNNPDDPKAFSAAVEEIVRLGRKKEYKLGYQQFNLFMEAGIEALSANPGRLDKLRNEVLENAAISIALNTFQGKAYVRERLLEAIEKHPKMKTKYDMLRKEMKPILEQKIPLEFEIEKDGEILGRLRFYKTERQKTLERITPGFYRVKLASGMQLWEGKISRDLLIWTVAFPGKKLDLAADTGEEIRGITRTISLFGGEISLLIGAGLESGWMMISKQ